MTHPVLQLKASRLKYYTEAPDRGDYLLVVDSDGRAHVAQLRHRFNGMLALAVLDSEQRMRINPYTLSSGHHYSGTEFRVVSVEQPPPMIRKVLDALPKCHALFKSVYLRSWFDDTLAKATTFTESLRTPPPGDAPLAELIGQIMSETDVPERVVYQWPGDLHNLNYYRKVSATSAIMCDRLGVPTKRNCVLIVNPEYQVVITGVYVETDDVAE